MGGSVEAAARALRRGELVALPTDTLVALAARAEDARAVDRLLAAKGRTSEHRLSVAVSSLEELELWSELPDTGRAWLRTNLPGPFTVLAVPSRAARARLPAALSGGARIGLRVPDHPLARELARQVGPITATSANRTGRPPATTVAAARAALGADVAVYLDGPPAPSGRPSTLVDLAGRRVRRLARR